MVCKHQRLLLGQILYLLLQPQHAFSRNKGRSHPYVRAARRAYELYATCLKLIPLVAEYPGKGVGAAFAPGIVVVSRNDEPRHFQIVKYVLGALEFSVRAKVGNVSVYYHELDLGIGVYVFHTLHCALLAWSSDAYVDVAHQGKLEAPVSL